MTPAEAFQIVDSVCASANGTREQHAQLSAALEVLRPVADVADDLETLYDTADAG
jgi:hypothetical protein